MDSMSERRGGRIGVGEALRLGVFAATLLGALAGCRYSFTGGSVPPHLKTIAIPIVQDQSGFGDPRLKDQLTDDLVNLFRNDNTLQLADRANADALLDATVTRVADEPLVVNPGEQVSQRRITITMHVTLTDQEKRRTMWEKDFSQWGDYPSGGGPTQRDAGIQDAVKKLTEDILNETVAGW